MSCSQLTTSWQYNTALMVGAPSDLICLPLCVLIVKSGKKILDFCADGAFKNILQMDCLRITKNRCPFVLTKAKCIELYETEL